ncbi:hypothetical protein O0I10_006991 [Lichtheimia ornata]|uniref:Uncharacterized protein n=1 Tax=Lichtheimia ornata TaxID=688661 RepID=A0AAD7V3T2_9FUNG|nr:uncharacterized protein O0I10_006991 [Lichtheimia ornata]KAJ8657176.1 hypothetical protein O0I10_006991 [Lichtheimia ornata]
MDGIKCSDEESWNVALVTCRVVVSRNDGSCHVDTAEDGDDGLDDIEELAHIFDKRCFTVMDGIGVLDSMDSAATLRSWMKYDYGGSNQEHNDTVIPIPSM